MIEYLREVSKKQDGNKDSGDSFVADVRRERRELEKGYRERALKMYPWVCGRCGRDFAGKRLRELTVHHRDHNHDNNPPDGSNWELLCLYCHENEHARNKVADAYVGDASAPDTRPTLSAKLGDLLKGRK